MCIRSDRAGTSSSKGERMEKKTVSKYVTDYDLDLKKVRYFAICGKERIEIPESFAGMCDDKHLEILKVESIEMPELLGVECPYWQPMRTCYD